MLDLPVPLPPTFDLKAGDPIRIVLTDGTVQDHVVDVVNGTTIKTHLPVSTVMGGAISKYYQATADRVPAFMEPDPMLAAMARSQHIYTVIDVSGAPVLAAFTVKHELVAWLERRQADVGPLGADDEVWRFVDGTSEACLMGTVGHVVAMAGVDR